MKARTAKHYLEIMPAACLSQRSHWRQAAQSLPYGGCLLVTDSRKPKQARLFQALIPYLRQKGRSVLVWNMGQG
jgi:hypothetical protein